MSTYAGLLKIVRFNWPWYAGAMLVTVFVPVVLTRCMLPPPWPTLAWALMGFADGWLLVSLVVSHVIYDRSSIARGGWLEGLGTVELGTEATGTAAKAAAEMRSVAIFHLGHDEASAHAARLLPSTNRRTFDVYDPMHSGSPSLTRARALAGAAKATATATATATSAAPNQLPLADGSIDLALVIFAAHELRHDVARADFFRELARIIGSHGRVLVVEHLRDGWNFFAYGPGYLHFLGHRTWLSTFAQARLRVTQETRLTPWVRRFELMRVACIDNQ